MTPVRKTHTTWPLPGLATLALMLGMQSGTTMAAPEDQDVFTDFETIDSTNFSIGTGDVTATFSGGFSGVAGILELYRSGTHAWMVNESNTGEIQFETNAAIVEFYARTLSTANGTSVLTAFDSQGQVVDSVTLNPGDPFQLVSFNGSIARIEFVNNATCANCMNSIDDFGFSPAGTGTVDLSGTVQTADGTDLCAMVLASGQFMFSCNPNGPFSLTGLPRENDGTVKRQVYVDGFFPEIDVLPDTVSETVVMTRAGTCPSYNPPYDPGVFPDSAGNRIDISGSVLLQDTPTPICAMVLANGQFMFSCDGSGSYALNIPLDTNGQFKLQVYADGFAPTIQSFDEFSATNDVRMARAVECQ